MPVWMWGQGLSTDLWSQVWVGRLGKLWPGAAEWHSLCGGLSIFRGLRQCLSVGQRVVQGSGSWHSDWWPWRPLSPGGLVCETQAFLSSLRGSSAKVDVVQSLSHVQLFVTPWTAAHQASLSFTISQGLLKLNVHWASDAIQPSHPLLSPSPPKEENFLNCNILICYKNNDRFRI